ncbi:MAG TPA: hypothetical protein VN754_06285 [Candidatus Binataceae bacterium]|nr:hypothetical protein [Candidatus Binataceae bacterium]
MVLEDAYSFSYLFDPVTQDYFPGLIVRVLKPGSPDSGVDLNVHFDSGASRSLLNGEIVVPALGLDLFSGPTQRYNPVTGSGLEGRLHKVEIFHPDLGSFVLDVGISTVPIRRNILGRDFFDLVQIGFREHHQTLFITPEP